MLVEATDIEHTDEPFHPFPRDMVDLRLLLSADRQQRQRSLPCDKGKRIVKFFLRDDNFSKREKLQISRQRAKLEKNLGSIADLTRLPAALFVVDVQKEANAVKEAKRLSIPVFAMVDTCCDPTDIDYVIPANDDATKSIAVVLEAMCAAIAEGTEERKLEKEKEAQEADAEGATVKKEGKPRIKKAVKAAIDAEEAAVAEVVAAVETPYEEPAAAPAEAAETAEEKAE